jgi:hypothetical protein
MAWEKQDAVDLSGGAATTLTTSVFTAKLFNNIFGYGEGSVSFNPQIRVGDTTIDTGSTYAGRRSFNGGADVTAVNQTEIVIEATSSSVPFFFVCWAFNFAVEEKLFIMDCVRQNTAGAGTAPNRRETVFKWVETTNQMDIEQLLASTGNLTTTTQLSSLGSD